MPPVVCVVGHSNSGKTTHVEKLLRVLSSRGYRIATMKHAREIEMDRPGTDSWRHLQAGSKVIALATRERIVLMEDASVPPTIDELVRLIGEDYDLVLVEGFKGEPAPKIEIQRNATGPLIAGLEGLIAVVSDDEITTGARRFSFADVSGLADMLETEYIKPNPEHLSVYADGVPITLTGLPREFVRNTMLAIASSLNGTSGARNLEFRFKRP